MITSIFSKSKPINFILVVALIVLLFFITNLKVVFSSLDNTFSALIRLGIATFFVFLIDFIISKNSLTQKNSYAIMTFGLLFAMFPTILEQTDFLISNLFLLLALRRLISLHSNIQIKKKLFDAGFWIMLAALFHFWAILYFALAIVALIYHSQNDIKNTIIPFAGMATVLLMLLTYNIIVHDSFIEPSNFKRFASLDFTRYNSGSYILKLTVLFASYIWILVYYFRTLPDKFKNLRPSYFLIAWSSIIAILMAIISPIKNGSEFIFLFAPFSIIMANYIEVISERWFKEIFVILLIITPIVSLLF